MIGYPSTCDLLLIIDWRLLLPNCPITRANIWAAEDIFGPNMHSLIKGKTIQHTKAHVSFLFVTPVPLDIRSLYHSMTLCINIMFINKLPFSSQYPETSSLVLLSCY